ncbi:MAG TPA: MFS transporter, partial [Aquihabitans sp.]|nr:MFS transporter [Aquihabitans sp.]
LSLAVTDGRGVGTWLAGAALSAGAVAWASASWVQARFIDRVGPRRLVTIGFSVLVGSIALMLGVALGLPVGLAVVSWAAAGAGMGLSYSPLSVTVLAAATPGEEGRASAALQLSDTLGVAVGTGIGGAIVALGDGRGWAVSSSTAIVFGVSVAVTALGLGAARRLPRRVPAGQAAAERAGPVEAAPAPA